MSEATKVKVSLGITMNLKNYQSLRIDVGIEDYKREGESMDAAMDRVYKYVEKQLEGRVDETCEEIKNSVNG